MKTIFSINVLFSLPYPDPLETIHWWFSNLNMDRDEEIRKRDQGVSCPRKNKNSILQYDHTVSNFSFSQKKKGSPFLGFALRYLLLAALYVC